MHPAGNKTIGMRLSCKHNKSYKMFAFLKLTVMPASGLKAVRRARIRAENAHFRAFFVLAPMVVINLPILDFAVSGGYNYTQFIYIRYSCCRTAHACLWRSEGAKPCLEYQSLGGRNKISCRMPVLPSCAVEKAAEWGLTKPFYRKATPIFYNTTPRGSAQCSSG